jgi:pyruvate/2-oxoacid:ferredoxin oxidoreductase beta subunit
MASAYDFDHEIDIAWCQGCGNFRILKSLKDALSGLGIDRMPWCLYQASARLPRRPST